MSFECPCKQKISDKNKIMSHFEDCSIIQKRSPLFNQFMQYDLQRLQLPTLYFLKGEINYYQKLLDKAIDAKSPSIKASPTKYSPLNNYESPTSSPKKTFSSSLVNFNPKSSDQLKMQILPSAEENDYDIDIDPSEDVEFDFGENVTTNNKKEEEKSLQQKLTCVVCKLIKSSTEIVNLDCSHNMCQNCGTDAINKIYKKKSLNLACPVCQKAVSKNNIKLFVPAEIYDLMEKEVEDCRFVGKNARKMEENQLVCAFGREILQSNYIFLECCHPTCKKCGSKELIQMFETKMSVNLRCRTCKLELTENDKISLVGESEYEKMSKKIMLESLNIVTCNNCGNEFEFTSGKFEKLKGCTDEQSKCFAENRFKCPKCNTEQCRKCVKEKKFHSGLTCEEYQKKQKSLRCRFCDSEMKVVVHQKEAWFDICQNNECSVHLKYASEIILPCGHPNCGVGNEVLPCLHEDCLDKTGIDGREYCNICYVEGIRQAPCVRTNCNHIFHFHCVKKRLETKWITPRMFFDFCLCPLCKTWLEFPSNSFLSQLLNKYKETFNKIKELSIQRLKAENRLNDEKLIKKESIYYNKPLDYAMKIYSYYECFKCKLPYFGGLKDCMRGMEDEKNDKWKPEELVCANCSNQNMVTECKLHGKDFIEFKCKFCCGIAQWYCWGNTHFCEPCHKKQVGGDYLNKKNRDQLPVCPGKASCPIGGNHPPNGEEFSLGCTLCRKQ